MAGLRELVPYTAVSACALALDLSTLWLLAQRLHVHYLIAATVAFTSGTALAYFLSVNFVFKFRRLQRREAEFGVFCAIGLLGLLINAVGITIGIETLHMPLLIAKGGTAAVTFLANFALRKLLLFTPAAPKTWVQSGDLSR